MAGDTASVLDDWRERSATLGRRVRVDLGADDVVGDAVDVTESGQLVLDTLEGERRVIAVGGRPWEGGATNPTRYASLGVRTDDAIGDPGRRTSTEHVVRGGGRRHASPRLPPRRGPFDRRGVGTGGVRAAGRSDRRRRAARAYLRTVVVNLARGQLRNWEVARRHPPPVPGMVLPSELDETWDALRQLPERQRTALVLRFYEDLPIAEVSTVLDCPIGTAKSLIHRGLRRLREVLES